MTGTRTGAARRGSALLVVLGMAAFMAVSGLAFSAYMRYSRLPSSFMRRSVTTRQLAKAALAEAITQVDNAIGDDLHPNLRAGDDGSNWNRWAGRVYVGNPTAHRQLAQSGTSTDFDATLSVGPSKTVSTLNLEALAYIPPPLVNDVRYYSRRVPSAQWQNFSFDAGRFAFSCVDVSDCFDVNRLFADAPRSSDPLGVVSGAYIFEEFEKVSAGNNSVAYDHVGPGEDADKWDSWMKKYRGEADDEQSPFYIPFDRSDPPFVSVADLNMAWWYKFKADGCCGLVSPFGKFVDPSTDRSYTSRGFYGTVNIRDEALERIRYEMFVTDGLFPPTREESEARAGNPKGDLSLYQPFASGALVFGADSKLAAILLNGANALSTAVAPWSKLSRLELCALYDYLDEDSLPVSLAVPTTERVPMVCGIEQRLGSFQIKVEQYRNGSLAAKAAADTVVAGNPNQDGQVTYERTEEYRIDANGIAAGLRGCKINALVAFPFIADSPQQAQNDANKKWQADGRLALFFATGEDGKPDTWIPLRAPNCGGLLPPEGPDFAKQDRNDLTQGLKGDAVFRMPLDPVEFSFADLASKPADADPQNTLDGSSVSFTVKASDANQLATALKGDKGTLLGIKYRWTANVKDGVVDKTEPTQSDIVSLWNKVKPLDRDGGVAAAYDLKSSDALDGTKAAAKIAALNSLALRAAVWVRIALTSDVVQREKDYPGRTVGNGTSSATKSTVDLVPACAFDDVNMNAASLQARIPYVRQMCGYEYPLLRFDIGKSFKCSPSDLARVSQTEAPTPRAIFVGDPRFNHAPENWFVAPSVNDWSKEAKSSWLAACGCSASGCDGDIYMSTSDLGFMQSVYELAFIPRLYPTALDANADLPAGAAGAPNNFTGYLERYNKTFQDDFAADLAGSRDAKFFWQTYSPYAISGRKADDFEGLNVYGGTEGGLRVNPYSDCTNVVVAAFANTPYSWRVAASECYWAGGKTPPYMNSSASDYNPAHAWNGYDMEERKKYGVPDGWRKFAWQSAVEMAQNFIEDIRSDDYAGKEWQEVFDGYDWSTQAEPGTILGVDCKTDNGNYAPCFRSVDRKFLYAFWRSSFAARQQLFLFFVRAEPMMMGGGVGGVAPPQLSARAAALVWRDPNPPKASGAPHRVRTLFYRQFE